MWNIRFSEIWFKHYVLLKYSEAAKYFRQRVEIFFSISVTNKNSKESQTEWGTGARIVRCMGSKGLADYGWSHCALILIQWTEGLVIFMGLGMFLGGHLFNVCHKPLSLLRQCLEELPDAGWSALLGKQPPPPPARSTQDIVLGLWYSLLTIFHCSHENKRISGPPFIVRAFFGSSA